MFESSAAAPISTAQSYTRTTPVRTPTPAGDVIVPLAQAGITGLVAGLLAIAVSVAAGWPWWAALLITSAVWALAWMWLLTDHRSLLRVTETITSAGDDQPVQVAPSQALRVEVTEHHAAHSDTLRFLDLPCDEGVMVKVAQGVLAGRAFSELEWTGRGHPLSINKFRQLRSSLLDGGYMRWASQADHRQGLMLTGKGRAMFTAIAHQGDR